MASRAAQPGSLALLLLLAVLAAILSGSATTFSPSPAKRARGELTARASTALLAPDDTAKMAESLRKDVARYEADLVRVQAELELYQLDEQLQLLEAKTAHLAELLSEQRQLTELEAEAASLLPPAEDRDPSKHFSTGKRDLVLPSLIAFASVIGDKADDSIVQVGFRDQGSPIPLSRQYASDSEQLLRHMKVAVVLETEAAERRRWSANLREEMAAWTKLYGGNLALAKRQSFVALEQLMAELASTLPQPVPSARRASLLDRIRTCREDVANGL